MKSFLLPCGCGCHIPVSPGQAGGRVQCGRCQAVLDVPRLGDLARYAASDPSAPAAPRRWTRWHASFVGGCATAVIAAVAALLLSTPAAPAVDVAGVRQAVSAASAGEVYRVWNQLARSGVARPPLPHERRLEQIARVAGTMSRWLAGLAVLGGMVGLVSAVALVVRKPPAGRGP